MKIDVQRQVHEDSLGRRVVTLKGTHFCLHAWMHFVGFFEATFYRYQTYTTKGRQAQLHSDSTMLKPWSHTAQATATLLCVLENLGDHMPHRIYTLKFGEKAVSMILLATFQ